jgi:hypothetical protein
MLWEDLYYIHNITPYVVTTFYLSGDVCEYLLCNYKSTIGLCFYPFES